MTSTKEKTIPARIITDRKHILKAVLNDMDSMSPEEFIEMFKVTREKYENMPMSHKSKKSKKSSKKPKLSTKTGWNIYSQHYLAEMQPEAFTLFEKFDKEEQESGKDKEDNNTITSKNLKKIIKKLKIEVTKEISSDELYKKFHLSQILRTEAGRLWKDEDKEEWNNKAEEINSQNLENWRNAYADEKNNFLLSAEDFVLKVKEYGPDSPETNIKKFKKPELIHLLGCIGRASEVTQCSKIGDLRSSLVAYYKGCN